MMRTAGKCGKVAFVNLNKKQFVQSAGVPKKGMGTSLSDGGGG